MSLVIKPIYLDLDGILSQVPNGAIVNIGGTNSSTFTVGGRGLLFDDGTSTSPGSVNLVTPQVAYNNVPSESGAAQILLVSGKDYVIASEANPSNYLKIDSETGNTIISGLLDVIGDINLSANLTIGGTINGIDLGNLNENFQNHLAGEIPFRHLAADIDVFPIPGIDAGNVQEALESINNRLEQTIVSNARGYEHIQSLSSSLWVINHSSNTMRTQVTVYDENWEQIIPERVKIINTNTIEVSFASPVSGSAMIFMF